MESSSRSSSSLSVLTSNTSNTLSSSNASTNAPSSSATAAAHSQSSLRALNRASCKISKPAVISRTSNPNANPKPLPKAQPPPLPSANAGIIAAGGRDSDSGAPLQPPVYNIDKNDFRDVVQKLTGSPVVHHARPAVPSTAPLPTASANSRLHRIRPPPLSQLAPLPSSLPPTAPLQAAAATSYVTNPWTRPPFSPLPPLPSVSTAAESPISAYMRGLRAGCDQPSFLTSGVDPLPSTLGPLNSPLVSGCLPSPRTAYQMMMAPALVSPTSPGVQLPSPRVNDS